METTSKTFIITTKMLHIESLMDLVKLRVSKIQVHKRHNDNGSRWA